MRKPLIDTEDFGLAIALVCCGYELVGLEQKKQGSSRITFRFASHQNINEDAQKYWSGKLAVDAKSYWNESKNLKTRLYSL